MNGRFASVFLFFNGRVVLFMMTKLIYGLVSLVVSLVCSTLVAPRSDVGYLRFTDKQK